MVDISVVEKILRTECEISSPINSETKLSEILDSISMLTLITHLENQYEVEIDDSVLEKPPETIKELLSLMNKFIKEKKNE